MKKILVLILAVSIVGFVSAKTDPVFSGTFSTYMAYSIPDEAMMDSVSDKMKLELNATIDEWNTVSVAVELADAMYEDGDGMYGDSFGNRGDYLRMKGFTLSSDIFGALGIDGPVGLKIKLGSFGFGAASVGNVAPLSTKSADGNGGTASNVGIGFDISIVDMITVGAVLYPTQLYEKTYEAGVTIKASGIAGMLDIAAYAVLSQISLHSRQDGDPEDDNGDSLGLSVALTPVDGLAFGLAFQYDLETDSGTTTKVIGPLGATSTVSSVLASAMKLQFDMKFSMVENLAIGLSYGLGDLEEIANTSAVKFSVTYDVMPALGFFGAVSVSDFERDSNDKSLIEDLGYDVGLNTAIAALSIRLGVSNSLDFKAPEDDFVDSVYLKFSTSF